MFELCVIWGCTKIILGGIGMYLGIKTVRHAWLYRR